jgi:hypothetical protein
MDRILALVKHIIVNNDREHISYSMVPKLKQALYEPAEEKPPDQVLRNYDYEVNNVYSNLNDWKTLDCKYNFSYKNRLVLVIALKPA